MKSKGGSGVAILLLVVAVILIAAGTWNFLGYKQPVSENSTPEPGNGEPENCTEDWNCTLWRPDGCPPSGVRIRECTDLNNCGTTKDKPPTELTCTPVCKDSTPYGRCSETRPKYCRNGTLIDKCSVCGCAPGYECVNQSCQLVQNESPLNTSGEVIKKVEEAYSDFENFEAVVNSYKGKINQSRENMAFQNSFNFYFQLNGTKSYTEVIEEGEGSVTSTHEPLRIIGEIQSYPGINLLGKESLGGRDTYLLEWEGESGETGAYPRWKMWIDEERWTVVRQDIYSGDVLGVKTRYEYKRVDGYWLPETVKSEYPTGDRMEINIRSEYQVNTEFPEEVREKLK